MSNLGGYQAAVELMKSLGGPRKAAIILGSLAATGGYAVLRGVEGGGKKLFKAVKSASEDTGTPKPTKDKVFTVIAGGEDNIGLKLRAGDQYRVLGWDADAILIEVLNDRNSPYFVSREFLRTVSDFPNA